MKKVLYDATVKREFPQLPRLSMGYNVWHGDLNMVRKRALEAKESDAPLCLNCERDNFLHRADPTVSMPRTVAKSLDQVRRMTEVAREAYPNATIGWYQIGLPTKGRYTDINNGDRYPMYRAGLNALSAPYRPSGEGFYELVDCLFPSVYLPDAWRARYSKKWHQHSSTVLRRLVDCAAAFHKRCVPLVLPIGFDVVESAIDWTDTVAAVADGAAIWANDDGLPGDVVSAINEYTDGREVAA